MFHQFLFSKRSMWFWWRNEGRSGLCLFKRKDNFYPYQTLIRKIWKRYKWLQRSMVRYYIHQII